MSAIEDQLDEAVRALLAERFGPTTRMLREKARTAGDAQLIERVAELRKADRDWEDRRNRKRRR